MINRENFASKEDYIKALSAESAKEAAWISGKKESTSNQFGKTNIGNVVVKIESEEVLALKAEIKEKDKIIVYQRERIEMLEKTLRDHGFNL